MYLSAAVNECILINASGQVFRRIQTTLVTVQQGLSDGDRSHGNPMYPGRNIGCRLLGHRIVRCRLFSHLHMTDDPRTDQLIQMVPERQVLMCCGLLRRKADRLAVGHADAELSVSAISVRLELAEGFRSYLLPAILQQHSELVLMHLLVDVDETGGFCIRRYSAPLFL